MVQPEECESGQDQEKAEKKKKREIWTSSI